jgi:signal transduction histidine kinase
MRSKNILLLTILSLIVCCSGNGQKLNFVSPVAHDTSAILALVDSAYNYWNVDPERGLQLSKIALEKSTDIAFKKGQASAYRTEAVCYWSIGSYAPALDASFKGIKIAQEINDLDVKLNLENIIALLFGDLGDLDQAIDTYRRYIKLIVELKRWDKLPAAYNNFGYYFSKKNMVDSSLYYYQKGIQLSDGKKEVLDGQYLFASLSEAYFTKKEYDKALEYCEKALPLYTKVNESIGVLECHIMLGQLEAIKGNYSLAEKRLDTAYAMAKKGNFNYFYGTILKLYSKIDSAKGNFKEAFIKFSRATRLQDSLTNIQQKTVFERMLIQYKTEQKEKENLLLKESNERIKADATLKLYLSIGVLFFSLFLILGLSVFFYKRAVYRKQVEEARLKEVINVEKIRIAKELHDNIGSQLSVISLDLAMLAKQNLLSAPLYLQLSESIKVTINELRDTIWAMNKEEVNLEQLIEKISNLCWRFRKSTDQFQINISESITDKKIGFKPNQGLNILRIVQESVSNAVRHSSGNLINVTAKVNLDRLIIKVNDNGRGFDKNKKISGDHLGLLNMKNRAEEIGANLTIDPIFNGTSIMLVVPIHT